MKKFITRADVVEAITFDDFVQGGRDAGANIVGGMPWSFHYKGRAVTHHDDKCYLVLINEAPHSLRFTPDDMLLTLVDGTPVILSRYAFDQLYEEAQ